MQGEANTETAGLYVESGWGSSCAVPLCTVAVITNYHKLSGLK